MKRFLITTALEETWCTEAPVLFLGTWCCKYDRKHIWRPLDSELAPYHWDDREKLHKDYLYINNLYEDILVGLAAELNALHNVNHSVRYWRILVGPWLNYFLSILYDRWFTVLRTLKDYEICGVKIIEDSDKPLIPNDMTHFIDLFLTDEWNESIFKDLLHLFKVPMEGVPRTRKTNNYIQKKSEKKLRNFKIHILNAINKCLSFFKNENEYFFISTYIPIKSELLLQLKLRQLPKLWRTPALEMSQHQSSQYRNQPNNPIEPNSFRDVASYMIKKHIPILYLEGYRELIKTVEDLPWPKRPRAIFTSGSWLADDIFKMWASRMTEIGVPFVIGQHGGNYGVGQWEATEDHQISISDYFLSWGWTLEGSKKVLPIGNFTNQWQERLSKDVVSKALMVEMAAPQMSYRMVSIPVAGQWLSYFEDQCRFVRALPESIRNDLLIRLYPQDYGWRQKERWLDAFPKISLEAGRIPMQKLLKDTKIYISTYNATT